MIQTTPPAQLTARDFMTQRLVTLRPEMDVIQAVQLLLKNRISGAPVVDADGQLVGIFSEKCAMQVVLDAAYEQLPSNQIRLFMDTDPQTIDPDTQLFSIAQVFLLTANRRLPVLENGALVERNDAPHGNVEAPKRKCGSKCFNRSILTSRAKFRRNRSRLHVMRASLDLLKHQPSRDEGATLLYLSALVERNDLPPWHSGNGVAELPYVATTSPSSFAGHNGLDDGTQKPSNCDDVLRVPCRVVNRNVLFLLHKTLMQQAIPEQQFGFGALFTLFHIASSRSRAVLENCPDWVSTSTIFRQLLVRLEF